MWVGLWKFFLEGGSFTSCRHVILMNKWVGKWCRWESELCLHVTSEMAFAALEDPHWFFCLRDLQGVHADVGATGASPSSTFRPSADNKNRLILWHHKSATGRRRHQNKKNGDLRDPEVFWVSRAAGGLCGDLWLCDCRGGGRWDVHLHPDHLRVFLLRLDRN